MRPAQDIATTRGRLGPDTLADRRETDHPNYGRQSHDLDPPISYQTASAGTQACMTGRPVQALEAEEVASTSYTSTPKALVDIGRALSASPTREYTHSM